MAKFAVKALVITALVCFVFDLVASENNQQQQQQPLVDTVKNANDHLKETYDNGDHSTSTVAPTSLKDKLKGFVSSVKEGAADAFESVSDSVSGAAHKLDEKRKEAVAGTKKLVNGAIEKIKNSYDSYKHGDDDKEVPRVTEKTNEGVLQKDATKTEKL